MSYIVNPPTQPNITLTLLTGFRQKFNVRSNTLSSASHKCPSDICPGNIFFNPTFFCGINIFSVVILFNLKKALPKI